MVIEFNPISLDILEDLLGVDYPEYEEGLFGRHEDNFCDACRAQYKKRWGKFRPLCEGSIDDQLQDLEAKGLTKDEAMYTRSTLDPVTWAALTLNWYADWYQSQYLKCSSLAKVCRWGRRLGKCVEERTLIMTPTGPVPIEQLSVGDEVYAYTIKTDKVSLTKVTAVHDQGMQTVVDLKRHNKYVLSCTAEHRWHTVYNDVRRMGKVRRLRAFNKNTAISRRFVDVPMGTQDEPHAYAIGALLGDGCSRERGTSLYISSETAAIPTKVAEILGTEVYETTANNYTWVLSYTSKGGGRSAPIVCSYYYEWCRGRYAHEKTCDLDVIKKWNRQTCLAFLAGLLDTDGSIMYDGHRLRVAWGMQAKPVIEAVKYLVFALFQYDISIAVDDRERYKNGPIHEAIINNNVFSARILKELDPYLVVEKKKWKAAYTDLPTRNENPDLFGVKFDLDETREAHCYDISVDTEDNLYLTAGGLVTHNTDSLCVDMLHKALTRPGKKEYESYTILVITPYEAQVDRIFGVLRNLIDRNAAVRESVLADIKNPQSISFTNKSIIKGFTSGVKSGNKSEKIRGEDSDNLVLDEADLLTKDDLEAILAIRASHPACSINFSTTPTGKRETFHEVCTIKDLGFKEFWRVSHESPRYTEETDTMFRKMYTFGGYQREMLAMFGEEAEGVFQKKYVDASIGTYEMHECVPHQDRMYLMGVDWNDHIHGTHIVINEYDPETEEFRIVAKDIIRGGEYTQLKSIDRIVELNQQWMPTYIGLDAGYGTTNEELLKIIGAKYPQTGLKEKMFAYNMSSKVIVKDAITGADLKKHIKPLMVEWSVQIMERGLQKFPASEDSKKGKGLVHQVRSYRKERVSPDGRPVYSQGYDHTLTAWNLSLLVFMLNETEFANSSRMVQFTRSGRPDKDGKINNSGKEVPKKQLRLFGAKRGGLVPTNQTVRADLKSMRKALRPTKRSNF